MWRDELKIECEEGKVVKYNNFVLQKFELERAIEKNILKEKFWIQRRKKLENKFPFLEEMWFGGSYRGYALKEKHWMRRR